eukprot:354247-Hanusia_phi.AAC.1
MKRCVNNNYTFSVSYLLLLPPPPSSSLLLPPPPSSSSIFTRAALVIAFDICAPDPPLASAGLLEAVARVP